jgi:hypothetical protein
MSIRTLCRHPHEDYQVRLRIWSYKAGRCFQQQGLHHYRLPRGHVPASSAMIRPNYEQLFWPNAQHYEESY